VVLSTLAIAALFSPLRRRLQVIIDRRFFRQKYNAERAVATFAAAARSETALNEITGQMLSVVEETVQPEQVWVWMKDGKQEPR
jgi:CII-binding regulator of phage lambda lysogenization HflD